MLIHIHQRNFEIFMASATSNEPYNILLKLLWTVLIFDYSIQTIISIFHNLKTKKQLVSLNRVSRVMPRLPNYEQRHLSNLLSLNKNKIQISRTMVSI